MLLFIVSCQKSTDKPFTEQEEFTSSFSSNQSEFSQARERPFRGRIEGNFAATQTTNPAIYIGSALAKGTGTYIGAFSKVTNDSITIVSTTTFAINGTFIMTNISVNKSQANMKVHPLLEAYLVHFPGFLMQRLRAVREGSPMLRAHSFFLLMVIIQLVMMEYF
jgi:hypothetical protein